MVSYYPSISSLIFLHNLFDIFLQLTCVFYTAFYILNSSKTNLKQSSFYRLTHVILACSLHQIVEKFRFNFINRYQLQIGLRPRLNPNGNPNYQGFPSGQAMTTGNLLYLVYHSNHTISTKTIVSSLFLSSLILRWLSGNHYLFQILAGLIVGVGEELLAKSILKLTSDIENFNTVKTP